MKLIYKRYEIAESGDAGSLIWDWIKLMKNTGCAPYFSTLSWDFILVRPYSYSEFPYALTAAARISLESFTCLEYLRP